MGISCVRIVRASNKEVCLQEDYVLDTVEVALYVNSKLEFTIELVRDNLHERIIDLVTGYCHCTRLRVNRLELEQHDNAVRVHLDCEPSCRTDATASHLPVLVIPLELVFNLAKHLDKSRLRGLTGITHVVIAWTNGRPILYEDYSRLGALLCTIGRLVRLGYDTSLTFLVVSFRLDGRLVELISRANITGVISRTGVTSRAIDVAKRGRVTLAGFARPSESRINIYTVGRLVIKPIV